MPFILTEEGYRRNNWIPELPLPFAYNMERAGSSFTLRLALVFFCSLSTNIWNHFATSSNTANCNPSVSPRENVLPFWFFFSSFFSVSEFQAVPTSPMSNGPCYLEDWSTINHPRDIFTCRHFVAHENFSQHIDASRSIRYQKETPVVYRQDLSTIASSSGSKRVVFQF